MSILFTLYLVAFALAGTNHKRGLALAPAGHPEDINLAGSARPSWMYDWAVQPPSSLPSSIKHIPMQWGRGSIDNFASHVRAQNATTILGFNEPDFASQSNIEPKTAAHLWKTYINPLAASGVKLGSPAVTSAPSGKVWMNQFLNACSGCTIDFLAIHWYGEGYQNFKSYVQSMHAAFPGRKLWVTEFAETRMDLSIVHDFLTHATNFLDSTDYIGGYAWFSYSRDPGGLRSNLITNGSLNVLGKQYVWA